MSKGKILFQLSGSIACFKACQVISRLVQQGYEVETVATRSALEFVGQATLEGLTGRKVHVDTFAPGEYMQHIRLARWADLAIVCPASANTINKFAAGIGDDLLSTLFLAHDFQKPFLLIPAMNEKMLWHPATQKALEQLREWDVTIVEPGKGSLACGETGDGRLAEPERIFAAIEGALRVSLPNALRVLVTAGGTVEPIDGVRAITNFSSGKTGARIADAFARTGHNVTLLRSVDAVEAEHVGRGLSSISFETFADLQTGLHHELANTTYDVVIHAAAVSDYSVATVEIDGRKTDRAGKFETGKEMSLHLKRNPKLIDSLRSWSRNPSIQIFAFKLTNSESTVDREEAIYKLARQANPDFIVHNDLHDISTNSDEPAKHEARIFAIERGAEGSIAPREVALCLNKAELAEALVHIAQKAAELSGRRHSITGPEAQA